MKRVLNGFAPSSRALRRIGIFALAAGLMPVTAAVAQEGPDGPDGGPAVFMADTSGTSAAVAADALLARAQEMNELRVIVELDSSFSPEGGLSSPAVASQRAGIQAAQERMMS
ncbi:MAG: hypothetical protein AAFO72_07405, partial [Pseudomonadota bacterium]